MKPLFLFDVDNVLVEANGYLRALQHTVTHFSRRMGVGAHAPTEAEVHAGEAHGLTSEWDSAATYIAALLIERLRQAPDLVPPARWPEVLDFLAAHPLTLAPPDYATWVTRIGRRLQYAGGTMTALVRSELQTWMQPLSETQHVALQPVLESLLGHTHDFDRAPIMRYFQHLTIGSERIWPTYGAPAQFPAAAYLQDYDVALLSPEWRAPLLGRVDAGQIGAVLYTARPSLPPADVAAPPRGYSPEAELAQSLVGLETWPLIGWGRVCWLAQQTGADAAILVKPSPVQALAAIGAAATGAEAAALAAAWALYHDQHLAAPLAGLDEVTVHVFEDSPGGLRAVQQAVQLLNAAGITAQYRPYGIAPVAGAKAAALTDMGVPTYPSVNAAIGVALRALV